MTDTSETFLLSSLLRQTASRIPDAVGLTDGTRELKFCEIHEAAGRVATYLAANGVTKGDRVLLFMANSIEFVLTYWGAVYSGAVVVPINADTKAQKLAWILNDCTPRAMFADTDLMPIAKEAAAGSETLLVTSDLTKNNDDTTLQDVLAGLAGTDWRIEPDLDQNLAAIIYTSGSTGMPKGVMLSHLNMLTAVRSVAQYLGYQETDRVFCAIPFTFDYGLHQINLTALTGACLLVERSFVQPLFSLHRLTKLGATVFPVVPTMVTLIEALIGRTDLSAIRTVTNTASALTLRQIGVLKRMFPAANIFSMYGLTECHRCTYLPPELLLTHPGSVGQAIPNTELWVIDESGNPCRNNAIGELVIRGSTVMKGYWQNAEQTARKLKPGPMPGEMVLHTGDICRLDADGLLYFVARKDDILKVRGEKVAPREVEDVLLSHPDVAQAAVFGEDDPVLGQKIVAFAEIGKPGPHAVAELLIWCKGRLEGYMVPSIIRIETALPRNENGKIDRLALRKLHAERGAPLAAAKVISGRIDLSETSVSPIPPLVDVQPREEERHV